MRTSPRTRRRFSAAATEDDPLSLVPNLFDVSIVLAVAFLLASLGVAVRDREGLARSRLEAGLRAATQAIDRQRDPAHLRPPGARKAEGRGARLGVAYRLENGEIIYVPD